LKKVPIHATVYGKLVAPLSLEFCDEDGNRVLIDSEDFCAKANTAPITKEMILDEISALAGTCF